MRIGFLPSLALVCLSACSLVPDYWRPDFDIPADWSFRDPKSPDVADLSPRWWEAFADAELNRLIVTALSGNLDLAAAADRVQQARAQAKIAGAPIWPDASLSAIGDDEFSDTPRGDKHTGDFGLSVNYEVDLWGRLRAGRDAALLRQRSVDFLRDALRLVVMADVAQAYFRVVSLGEQQKIAVDNIKNAREILRIVDIRFELGAVSALDLAQQKTELAGQISQLELLRQQTRVARNALAILLGLAPQELRLRAKAINAIAVPKLRPPAPSTLFDRRPDIRQAELELLAANTDIGVARAAFYPRLQLGLETLFTTGRAMQPGGLILALVGELAQPIFQGGRLEGELERSESRRDELLQNYHQAVLVALQEVEDAVVIRKQSELRAKALRVAAAEAGKAYGLSLDLYEAGARDFQTVLTAQRNLLDSQSTLVQANEQILSATVLIFRALGGGWTEAG
ncbi:MAG: efflux transporter outer membrane subunit [Methylococcaceae bacterium]|nr:efflux transporter outer membrane subunit [Methylococcaceae bacterium]MCI0733694.1 efflux transporter outer membrane subunit [Methylococcaceae bacterium]